MDRIKELWKRFGYYITLLAVVTLIGSAAYIIKNGVAVKEEGKPAPTPMRAAASRDEKLGEKTLSNDMLWPVSPGEVITPNSPKEPVWSELLQMYHTHEGVDIACVMGQAVRAAESGSVAALYYDESLGNTIEIKHENGVRTVYSNLSTLNLVKIGQSVRRGDVIAAVGDTSRIESAMEPHLHFEAYKNGEWLELPAP